ncbi:MAG: MFS transporter [Bacilli bacterium]|nr:MFS transporter [Bacilli bacterium]MBN2876868.1 MFS transporter [Bacilli bacterium]
MENQIAPRRNAFTNKNFALLFGGVLVSNIGHILFNFAMSLYILRIAKEVVGDAAPAVQGAYLLVSGLILVILMPFGGAMADRLNKVKIMWLTDFIRGFTILGTGAVIFFVQDPLIKIIFLFIMAIILGANSAFFNPASASLLKFIVDEDDLQQASSYLSGSRSIQNIAGLVLGGILYALMGIYVLFIINGIAYIISAITEIFITYDKNVPKEKTTFKIIIQDIVTGVKYVYGFKPIFVLLMMALFLNFFVSPMFENAMPFFAANALTIHESELLFYSKGMTAELWYSMILLASSISGIIMSVILSMQKTKEIYHRQINSNLVMFLILSLTVSAVMSLYYLGIVGVNFALISMIVLMFLMGFNMMGFNIPVGVIIQKQVDGDHLGKVQSVLSVLSQALIPLAGFLGGILLAYFTAYSLYIFSSLGMLVTVVLYICNKYSKVI